MKVAVFGEGQVANRVARDLLDAGLEIFRFASAFEVQKELSECELGICTEGLDAAELLAGAAGCLERGVAVVATCQSEESLEALGTLRDEARERDLIVLAGTGWSPGISNLMARVGYEELEAPSQVKISWAVSGVGIGSHAGLTRVVESLSGTAVSYDDGTWVRSAAGEYEEQVFFPEPVGWRDVRLAAGIEPLTLPSVMPGLDRITVKGGGIGFGSDWLTRRASDITRLSATGSKRRAGRFLGSLVSIGSRFSGVHSGWTALRVDILGGKADQPKTLTFGVLDLLPNLDAVPLVTAALMFSDGEIKGSGVFSPEEAIEPRRFFARLAERGVRVARLEREG